MTGQRLPTDDPRQNRHQSRQCAAHCDHGRRRHDRRGGTPTPAPTASAKSCHDRRGKPAANGWRRRARLIDPRPACRRQGDPSPGSAGPAGQSRRVARGHLRQVGALRRRRGAPARLRPLARQGPSEPINVGTAAESPSTGSPVCTCRRFRAGSPSMSRHRGRRCRHPGCRLQVSPQAKAGNGGFRAPSRAVDARSRRYLDRCPIAFGGRVRLAWRSRRPRFWWRGRSDRGAGRPRLPRPSGRARSSPDG
jgi:hypothetical protein